MSKIMEKEDGYELVTRTDEVAMYKTATPCGKAYYYVVLDVNKTPSEEFPYMLKHYSDMKEAEKMFSNLVNDDLRDKSRALEPCVLMFDGLFLTFDKNEINGVGKTGDDISKAMKFNFVVAKAIKSTIQQTIVIVKV